MATIVGDVGNDTLNGTSGDDTLNGGNGITANLRTGVIADDGFGNREVITGTGFVPYLIGSKYDDNIMGSNRDETFVLFAGTDVLNGRGRVDLCAMTERGF